MKVTMAELRAYPDGTVFSENTNDGLVGEKILYKKVENLSRREYPPDGDIMVEEMCLSQFSEVPGEKFRLGYKDDDEIEWNVWEVSDIEKMIGWLMTSAQCLDYE